MKMCIITAHAGADSLQQAVESWLGKKVSPMAGMCPPDLFIPNDDISARATPQIMVTSGRSGMLPAFQHAFGSTGEYEILAFLHDDTIVNDPDWIVKVKSEFEDPTVGLVGFGGATRHGDPFMYKKPYEYQQLARAGFASNMRDAENHGERFTGARDVAVLDGFALIVRRALLETAGGWPMNTPIGYICYDYWLCCMARRLGYRIRLVGVACDHLGGQTFVKLGMGRDEKHWKQYIDSHRYIYDEFKDVLPYEVQR